METTTIAHGEFRSTSPPQASSTSLTTLVNPITLLDHLIDIITLTLGTTKRELESGTSLLSKTRYSETLQRCSKFAGEGLPALYASKELIESVNLNDTKGWIQSCSLEGITSLRP